MAEEKHLSDFYSTEHPPRRATVSEDRYHYIVRMYVEDQLIETRLISEKTLQYAEDCAENYVQGWGEFAP